MGSPTTKGESMGKARYDLNRTFTAGEILDILEGARNESYRTAKALKEKAQATAGWAAEELMDQYRQEQIVCETYADAAYKIRQLVRVEE